jgi:hypothetical protein
MKKYHKTSIMNRLAIAKEIKANPVDDLYAVTRRWKVSSRFNTELKRGGFVQEIDGKWTWVKQYPDEKMIEKIMKLETAQKKKPVQPELNLDLQPDRSLLRLEQTTVAALDRIYESLVDIRQELRSHEVRLMDIEGRINGKPKRKFRFHFPIKFQKIITKE